MGGRGKRRGEREGEREKERGASPIDRYPVQIRLICAGFRRRLFANKIAAELRELQCRKSARRAPTVSLLNSKEEPPIARRHRLQITVTFSPVMMKAPAMVSIFKGFSSLTID